MGDGLTVHNTPNWSNHFLPGQTPRLKLTLRRSSNISPRRDAVGVGESSNHLDSRQVIAGRRSSKPENQKVIQSKQKHSSHDQAQNLFEQQHISGSDSETSNAGRSLRKSIQNVSVMFEEDVADDTRRNEEKKNYDAVSLQLHTDASKNSVVAPPKALRSALNCDMFPSDETNETNETNRNGSKAVVADNGGAIKEVNDLKELTNSKPHANITAPLAHQRLPIEHLTTTQQAERRGTVDAPILAERRGLLNRPIQFESEDLAALLRKHEKDMLADQEYLMKPCLRRARLEAVEMPRPELEGNLDDPFAAVEKVQPAALITTPQPSATDENRIQLRSTVFNGTQSREGAIDCKSIPYESPALTLPTYKSIVRLGPNVLARNDRTLKYLPYFNEEEGPKGQQDGLYEELRKRFNDRVKTLPAQRRCGEMADWWREYVEYFLDDVGIDFADILYVLLHEQDSSWEPDVDQSSAALSAWMLREEECPRCETTIRSSSWCRFWETLPHRDGRTFALAAIACRVFLDASRFSIWHVASTAPAIKRLVKLQRQQETAPCPKHPSNDLCLICHVHDCPSHGAYQEHASDSSSSSGEDSHTENELDDNFREYVTLPDEPRSSHQCGTLGVSHNDPCRGLLGLRDSGDISGTFNAIVLGKSAAAFDDRQLCSDNCYWDVGNRPDVSVKEVLDNALYVEWFKSLDHEDRKLYATMAQNYSTSRRGPCMVALGIRKVSCAQIFCKMLVDINSGHHVETTARQTAPMVAKKPSSLDCWQEDSDAHRHEFHTPFKPCSHVGPCDHRCSCFENGVACEWICGCDRGCLRRFRGCACAAKGKKTCYENDKCPCWRLNRECDPWLCRSCGVLEVLDPVNRYDEEVQKSRCKNASLQLDVPKRTLKGLSEVQGWGLFAGEDIAKNEFIGEYKGEIVSKEEADRRGAVYHHRGLEYLFSLNKHQEVDSSRAGNKMRFVNNSNRQDIINVVAHLKLCNGVQRIGLFSKRTILAGEELFFHYGYPKHVTKKFWERGDDPGQKATERAQRYTSSDEDDVDTTSKARATKKGLNAAKYYRKKDLGKITHSLHQPRINGRFARMAHDKDGEDVNEHEHRQLSVKTGKGSGLSSSSRKRKRANGKETEVDKRVIPEVEQEQDTTIANEEEEEARIRAEHGRDGGTARSASNHQAREIAESEGDDEYDADNASDEEPLTEDEVDGEDEDAEVSLHEEEEDDDDDDDSSPEIERRHKKRTGDARHGGKSQKKGWVTRKQNILGAKDRAVKVARKRMSHTAKKVRGPMTAKGSYRGVGGRPRKRGML